MPGAPMADAVLTELEGRVKSLVDTGYRPGLATILVGDDDASARYVGMKQAKAVELGFPSPPANLPARAPKADVGGAIRELNTDPSVDAILFQHPTPPQIDYESALL